MTQLHWLFCSLTLLSATTAGAQHRIVTQGNDQLAIIVADGSSE